MMQRRGIRETREAAHLAPPGHPGDAEVRALVVRPERFELPTFGFVVRRSIQLS